MRCRNISVLLSSKQPAPSTNGALKAGKKRLWCSGSGVCVCTLAPFHTLRPPLLLQERPEDRLETWGTVALGDRHILRASRLVP